MPLNSFVVCKQVGLSRARRLAQGQMIKIQLLAELPVQIDGEPWIQPPCTLAISHHGQVPLSPTPLLHYVFLLSLQYLDFCYPFMLDIILNSYFDLVIHLGFLGVAESLFVVKDVMLSFLFAKE